MTVGIKILKAIAFAWLGKCDPLSYEDVHTLAHFPTIGDPFELAYGTTVPVNILFRNLAKEYPYYIQYVQAQWTSPGDPSALKHNGTHYIPKPVLHVAPEEEQTVVLPLQVDTDPGNVGLVVSVAYADKGEIGHRKVVVERTVNVKSLGIWAWLDLEAIVIYFVMGATAFAVWSYVRPSKLSKKHSSSTGVGVLAKSRSRSRTPHNGGGASSEGASGSGEGGDWLPKHLKKGGGTR